MLLGGGINWLHLITIHTLTEMKRCKILYFSRNQSHASAFENKARSILSGLKKDYLKERYEKDEAFVAAQAKSSLFAEVIILDSLVIRSVEKGTFDEKDTQERQDTSIVGRNDLGDYLSSYDGKLSELYVIIDYVSFCEDKNYSFASSFIIRELILKYPEVNFAFDEHLIHKYNVSGISFVDFLITTDSLDYADYINAVTSNTEEISAFKANNSLSVRDLINRDIHSFDIDGEDSILRLCYFNDNLFDASNLRFALKAQKYHNLVINKPNFARTQLSRATNLALVVEEERSQNLFNCYSAYASGYRCLPVTTASGLIWSNNHYNPQIILRDYDLQFPDESGDKEIHLVRGWKNKQEGQRIPWRCLLDNSNTYWNNLYSYNSVNSIDAPITPVYNNSLKGVFYVSKGVPGLSIKLNGPFGKNSKNGLLLRLPGVEKPISGVYTSFLPMFGEVYNKAIYSKKNSARDYIDTTRKKGYHGVPLDIYYLVKSMVDRACQYYSDARYIHAAVLAQETIEVLNGFHESLLLKAYHILAISENAIAMNAIGGDEEALKTDAIFRIRKIDYEIERILRRPKENGNGDEDRREFKYNILNQIYSDCRKFCKDKEHFSAEDCYISAMAHINEGFTPCDIIHEFIRLIKKCRNSWEAKKNGISIDDYV